MKRSTKIAGVAAVLLLFGLGAKAATDDEDDGDEPLPPPGPNPLDPVIPPGPNPPKPPKCNYSGCPAFDATHAAPSYYALRIQQLGYPIDVAAVAAKQDEITVQPQRGYVGLFQKHWNSLQKNTDGFPPPIAVKLKPIKDYGKLGVDEWLGERTIGALDRAHAAVLLTGIKWEDLIRIVEGSG